MKLKIMRKTSILAAIIGLFFFVGCQTVDDLFEEVADVVESSDSRLTGTPFDIPEGSVLPGYLIVRVTDKAVDKFAISSEGEVSLQSAPTQLQEAFSAIGAAKMERLFPPAGKYEGRTRREGLHRWMIIEFDEEVNVAAAMTRFSSLNEVEIVEPAHVMELFSDKKPGMTLEPSPLSYFARDNKMPFNDPHLSKQWHYNNRGRTSVNGGVEGADVNLFKAWEIETGSADVVVCIVDGGLDPSHPDLVDNMWVNPGEVAGDGVDNDKNGYVDDVHGWCFVDRTGKLVPDEGAHGVHVGGTVSARNNNGIGVAGVAGGDGSPGSGVKLMGASVFKDKRQAANFAPAIKYGADAGAHISQNSWGARAATPTSYKQAIDYFIKYAGCDDNGNQLPDSPIKGGIVIVAAGNDNSEGIFYPAEYVNSLTVAASGTNFKKASYSNYAHWVNITAPGGDQDSYGYYAGVYSTVSPKALYYAGSNTYYDYFQGTSMACPHVSGVAALVISHFGGPGFTSEELRSRLLNTVYPIDIDAENPRYKGKLGVGYVDAYAALTLMNEDKAPDKPQFLVDKSQKEAGYVDLNIYWTVPKDEDDGTPIKYKLYMSDKELTASNYASVGNAQGSNGFISNDGKDVGDEMHYLVDKLNTETKYYFALVAYDRWDLKSEPAFMNVTTLKNNPAVITNMPDEPFVVFAGDEFNTVLDVDEPDGHTWSAALKRQTHGVSVKKESNSKLSLRILSALSEGSYQFGIVLTDELGLESEFDFDFHIIKIEPPKIEKSIGAQLLGLKQGDVSIDLSEVFSTNPMLTLSYEVSSDNGSVVAAKEEGGKLVLQPKKAGRTVVKVVADNGYHDTELKVTVTVAEDKDVEVYSVWPLPVTDELNVWVNSSIKNVTFEMYTLMGERVFRSSSSVGLDQIASTKVGKLAPGSYKLRIKADGKNIYEQNILKH